MDIATELHWQDKYFGVPRERVIASERWGYDAIFTAGDTHTSDALTPMGYIAAITERIKIGTRIASVTGRTPTATAMAYQTIDHMAGGNRTIIGLGASNPESVEGFHGVAWGNPVQRMREFVDVCRLVGSGQAVDHQGASFSVPYRGPGHHDAAAKVPLLVPNPDLPIYIAAFGPQMVALAAEVADGFFPTSFRPGMLKTVYGPHLEKGFARAGGRKGYDNFKIWTHVDFIVDDDVRTAMRPFKQYVCTWPEFHTSLMEATGFADAAAKIKQTVEDRKLGDHRSIEDSPLLDDPMLDLVPDEYIDGGWLCGPLSRFPKLLEPWVESGLTGIIFRDGPPVGEDRSHATENLEAFKFFAHHFDKSGGD